MTGHYGGLVAIGWKWLDDPTHSSANAGEFITETLHYVEFLFNFVPYKDSLLLLNQYMFPCSVL